MTEWEWEDLMAYSAAQRSLGVDRDVSEDEVPWPETDNVMFKYLIQTTWDAIREDLSPEGLMDNLVWLAVHAWFEGGIAEQARREEENGS